MHHLLSDLTPILHNKKRNIVLGGDFNVSVQFDEQYKNQFPLHELIFKRLEDFGLLNCTEKFFQKHVQTHVHNKSDFEWQDDYLFVSKNIFEKVVNCQVLGNTEILNFSDHIPVTIEIEV
jgi:exonuclease III